MVIWDYVVPFDFFWVWDLIIIQINNLNNNNNWEFYRFMSKGERQFNVKCLLLNSLKSEEKYGESEQIFNQIEEDVNSIK